MKAGWRRPWLCEFDVFQSFWSAQKLYNRRTFVWQSKNVLLMAQNLVKHHQKYTLRFTIVTRCHEIDRILAQSPAEYDMALDHHARLYHLFNLVKWVTWQQTAHQSEYLLRFTILQLSTAAVSCTGEYIDRVWGSMSALIDIDPDIRLICWAQKVYKISMLSFVLESSGTSKGTERTHKRFAVAINICRRWQFSWKQLSGTISWTKCRTKAPSICSHHYLEQRGGCHLSQRYAEPMYQYSAYRVSGIWRIWSVACFGAYRSLINNISSKFYGRRNLCLADSTMHQQHLQGRHIAELCWEHNYSKLA